MSILQIYEPGQTPAPHEEGAAVHLAVGIDLGTTHSVVSVVQADVPVALADAAGRSIIPSIVCAAPYANGDASKAALNKMDALLVGGDGVGSIKRLMGRSYAEACELMPQLADLLVKSDADTLPRIRLGNHVYTPVELSAAIVRHLKHIAEQALSQPITQAVITVPAYFDDAARAATKDAARLAGVDVLRLVNEPTAAALAYGLEHGVEGVYAVYDLGGGTFDVSLLRLRGGVFQVLATAGDAALGGDDIDAALARMFYDSVTGEALQAARLAKEQLATQPHVMLHGKPCTRAHLAEAVQPLLARTLAICADAMEQAEMQTEQLQGVVLAGGSTRLYGLRDAVGAFFAGAPVLDDADPDKIVAYGAARQAWQLTQGGEHLLLDVVPLSLGLETMGDLVEKIIWRNTPIPVAMAQEFTTYADGQTAMSIHVVQGEREFASDCRSLARFSLSGIPPMGAGIARIRVSFSVDADGLLHVSAQEMTTGVCQQVEVRPSYGLPLEEMERMLYESMEYGREDMTARLLTEARVDAERTLRDLEAAIVADGMLLDAAERQHINNATHALQAAVTGDDRDAIDYAHQQLAHAAASFVQKRMDKAIQSALQGHNVSSI